MADTVAPGWPVAAGVAHGTILDRITVSDWVARITEIELGLGEGALEERRKSV